MGVIYKVTNTINGKIYIGQTRKTLKLRFKQHVNDCKYYNNHFSLALRKYSINVWQTEVLEETDDNLLNEKEIYWISKYNTFKNGYNSTTGGDVPDNISQEARDKIRTSKLGKKRSAEYCKKMKEISTGRPKSKNELELLRIKNIGDKNPMFGKNPYQIWTIKYGKEEADKRMKSMVENRRLTKEKNKNDNKS